MKVSETFKSLCRKEKKSLKLTEDHTCKLKYNNKSIMLAPNIYDIGHGQRPFYKAGESWKL